jgi:hypothetical protein
MATMTSDPFVNHVPVMTGGVGYDEVRHFYSTYFIPGQPTDSEVVPVTRTVGKDRIVDELIHKFTHTIEMPWILPGIRPRAGESKLPSSWLSSLKMERSPANPFTGTKPPCLRR